MTDVISVEIPTKYLKYSIQFVEEFTAMLKAFSAHTRMVLCLEVYICRVIDHTEMINEAKPNAASQHSPSEH